MRLHNLTGIVTTDIAAVTRGRFIATERLATITDTGVGYRLLND